MDGRDSAECQNWEKRDITGINGIVEVRKRQNMISVVSYICKKKPKTGEGCRRCRKMDFCVLEREQVTSL